MRISGSARIRLSTLPFTFGATLWLAGCGLMPPAAVSVPEPRLLATYVILGENGTAWARAITSATTEGQENAICPLITVDGQAQRMKVRAAAANVPWRKTANDAAYSKPTSFPVLTCEFSLPEKAARASVGGVELPVPKANPRRIVLLGDTGCRMKEAENAWQACNDESKWPFRTVAEAAASMAPDLVIHVGDFHYRENPCPAGMAGCQGSPWGHGWDTWDADLFRPAAKLLAAAPWIVARGNHEECRRAGQGWFRFLDPQPFEEIRSCNDAKNDPIGNFSPPYAVPVSPDLQFIFFDSNIAGHVPLDLSKASDVHALAQYRRQFARVDELAGKPGVKSMFINHHLILAYALDAKAGLVGGSPSQLTAMKSRHSLAYYPPTVQLAVHGHVHLFEAINFSSNHPAAIVSGMGGTEADPNLPDPFPMHVAPAEGVTLESITHSNEFGFAVMERKESTWEITAYDPHGKRKTTCVLTGAKLHCDKTGLLK